MNKAIVISVRIMNKAIVISVIVIFIMYYL